MISGRYGNHFHSIFPDHRKVIIADVLERDLKLAREKYGYETVQLPDGDESLPFGEKGFDVVFCSSVLEHVTGPKDEVEWKKDGAHFEAVGRKHQWAFATEIRRIAKRYYVQTRTGISLLKAIAGCRALSCSSLALCLFTCCGS